MQQHSKCHILRLARSIPDLSTSRVWIDWKDEQKEQKGHVSQPATISLTWAFWCHDMQYLHLFLIFSITLLLHRKHLMAQYSLFTTNFFAPPSSFCGMPWNQYEAWPGNQVVSFRDTASEAMCTLFGPVACIRSGNRREELLCIQSIVAPPSSAMLLLVSGGGLLVIVPSHLLFFCNVTLLATHQLMSSSHSCWTGTNSSMHSLLVQLSTSQGNYLSFILPMLRSAPFQVVAELCKWQVR